MVLKYGPKSPKNGPMKNNPQFRRSLGLRIFICLCVLNKSKKRTFAKISVNEMVSIMSLNFSSNYYEQTRTRNKIKANIWYKPFL